MEAFFAINEDVRHERSFFILLSITDPVTLRQSKFTDYETDIIKNALEKLHRQRILKEHVALYLLESQLE